MPSPAMAPTAASNRTGFKARLPVAHKGPYAEHDDRAGNNQADHSQRFRKGYQRSGRICQCGVKFDKGH